jgi:hypothetical protein
MPFVPARGPGAFGSSVSALAGACLETPRDALPADEVPVLEVGTGTYRFEPVTDGDTLPLVFGAQGGWHLWVAIRVSAASRMTRGASR